jgi:resuscitation-promoting factor RpfB
MILVRRVLTLVVVSVIGIALLAPLAARSAARLPAIPPTPMLVVGGGPVAAQRSLLSARVAGAARSEAPAEALEAHPIPTPASATMRPTMVAVGVPPPAAPAGVALADTAVWDALAQCESGGDWGLNTGNGYYGGLQFSFGTWHDYGGGAYADYPHQATREQQIAVAERLRAARGYAPWPACRAELGLP